MRRPKVPASISVLVVDDFADGLELVAEYLMFRGYQVHVASGGAEAIHVARTFKPDIVLMDLRMPGIDGWQAAKALRSDPETKTICIIAVTAHALRPERDRARAAGCDGVICKPFDIKALADALPRVLKDGAQALDVPGLSLTARRRAPTKRRRGKSRSS